MIILLLVNIRLFSDEMTRQGIELEEGWNLVSFNVIPADNTISAVFSELISSGDLVQIKTTKESFLPSQEEYLNTLQNIEAGVGYAIRMGGSNTLQLSGENIDVSTAVLELRTGWNLAGFPLQNSMEVEEAFAELISSGILEKVQSETESFDPDLPGAFNTLDVLEPGQAYWVQVNAGIDFIYPGRGNCGGAVRNREIFPRPWEIVFYPTSTIAYCNVTIDGEQAESGDEVGSFIDGECRGVGVVFIMNGNATTFFTIQTTQVETVYFNVWDASEDEVLEVNYYTLTNPGGDIGYPPDQLPIDATGIVEASWEPVIYKHSTTLLGRVSINGESAAIGDMVAAYVVGECRGSREVVIFGGVAYITLLVQGELNESLNFKVWDVSENEKYDLEYVMESDPGEVFGYPPDYLEFYYGEVGFGFDLPAELSFISGDSIMLDLGEYIDYLFMDEITVSYEGNEQILVEQNGFDFIFSSIEGYTGAEQIVFEVENTKSGEIITDEMTVTVTPTGEVEIIAVSDVPDDEGGYVEISFSSSYYDSGDAPEEEHYIIWQLVDEQWQISTELSASGNTQYQVIVTTQSDSTSGDMAIESFQVEFVMQEGSWQSEISQGYSVDNLAPAAPMGLEFTEGNLVWEIVPAEDLAEFDIYLDGEYWLATVWQQIDMIGIVGEIGIVSVDIHGNESEISELLYGGFSYGDIDVSLGVDAYDASLVLQYFCELDTGEIEVPWQNWRQQLADVDANGSIEAYDAGLILRYSVGLIDEFPVENAVTRNKDRRYLEEKK